MTDSPVNITLNFSYVNSFLSSSDDKFDMQFMHNLDSASNSIFQLMPLLIGVPQLLLNIFVVSSVILITTKKLSGNGIEEAARGNKPAFSFVANLAMADILMVIVEITVVHLQMKSHSIETGDEMMILNLINGTDPSVVSSEREVACRLQISLWMFTIANTLLASLLITVDRYIYITRGLRYAVIMTPKKVSFMIGISWLFPIVWSYGTLLLLNQQTDAECVVGHLLPLFYTTLSLGALIIVFLSIYALYSLILVKFFRRKRRLEMARNQGSVLNIDQVSSNRSRSRKITLVAYNSTNDDIGDNDEGTRIRRRSVSIIRTLSVMTRFTRAAKYVVILLLTFTLAWLPWLILLSYDIFLHATSKWKNSLEVQNCLEELPRLHPISLQICLFHALRDARHSCVITSAEPLSLCRLILEAEHAKYLDCWQKIALVIGATNSILNPIIYAFWYADFRAKIIRAWRAAFKCH